jgi:Uma2 family endonuclease
MIAATSANDTFADLLERLGHVPAERIRLVPPPGFATEADVIALEGRADTRIFELIDGTIVEKAGGYSESALATFLLVLLDAFVRPRNLGVVTGEQGMMRLWPGRVRIPDVAFVSWDRLPGRRVPLEPIPTIAPDLAVEVVNRSNTPVEMRLKRQDYFRMGTRLVWEIDPVARAVSVFTTPDQPTVLSRTDTLDGGPVLTGFALSVADLFAELDRHG